MLAFLHLCILFVFFHKSHICKNVYYWDLGQSVLSQSYQRIFSSAKSPGQTNEIAWFFAYWYKFRYIKVDQNFWLGMVKNVLGQSGQGTLKLNVSQKWTDGSNSFFTCCCIFRKAKSYFNNFWVSMVKNWHGQFKNCSMLRMS